MDHRCLAMFQFETAKTFLSNKDEGDRLMMHAASEGNERKLKSLEQFTGLDYAKFLIEEHAAAGHFDALVLVLMIFPKCDALFRSCQHDGAEISSQERSCGCRNVPLSRHVGRLQPGICKKWG